MQQFILTQTQFNQWDNFCLDNGETMYKNGDAYMNGYDEDTKTFSVRVSQTEQSGIIKFLEKVLDTF